MKRKDCEGCVIIDKNNCSWFEESLTCPCSICLIKVMCTHTCDLLIRHQVKVHGSWLTTKKEN